MNKTSILVVEDDKAVRNLIATTLETQGYDYLTAETGASALMQAVSGHPDIMILDLGLPDMDGVVPSSPRWCRRLRAELSGRWSPCLRV